MPKDEFDFDDPMELSGVGIVCGEDTTEAMTECFVEEFMRLGHNHKQILALFRNPHYLGMNLALQHRGEQFVRDKINEVFARWGRPAVWQNSIADPPSVNPEVGRVTPCAPPLIESDNGAHGVLRPATDPMGAPIPDVTL